MWGDGVEYGICGERRYICRNSLKTDGSRWWKGERDFMTLHYIGTCYCLEHLRCGCCWWYTDYSVELY